MNSQIHQLRGMLENATSSHINDDDRFHAPRPQVVVSPTSDGNFLLLLLRIFMGRSQRVILMGKAHII